MKRLLTLGLLAVLVLSTVGCCRPLFRRPLLRGGLFDCDPCQTTYEGGVIISDNDVPVPADSSE